jgi:putative tryptophan/tyrosine transport system substrate-binding protein
MAWRLVGLTALVLGAGVSARGDVVIVTSSDAAPYEQAQGVLMEHLTTPERKPRSVTMKQLEERGLGSEISTTDTVVAIGTPAATWLHNQLPEGIQMVYCMVADPEDSGLLGGSPCWGVTMEVSEADQFTLISQALPSAKVVGMLYRSDSDAGKQALETFRQQLPKGWRLEAVAVNDYSTVAAAIDALTAQRIDIIWTCADAKVYDAAAVRELLLASLRSKVPVWGYSLAFVRAGALLGAAVDPESQALQACEMIASLQNDKESVQKLQSPKDYLIAINLVVADQLGIQVGDALVKKAKFVFGSEN